VAELAATLGVEAPTHKGGVGQLVEWALGAHRDAGARPDFPDLGVELKTIPIGPNGAPRESTFCCAIDRLTTEHARWATSRLRCKLARVLWVPVQGRPTRLCDRLFAAPLLWTPSTAEERALHADWEDLMGALAAGRDVTAHEGAVLQVRPKGRRASDRVLATGADGPTREMPVAFYLRACFTARLLAAR
jgi:DNA mismatch repair protein MutH